MFNKMNLFVYSGTGNTYKIAKIISDAADKKNIRSSISMIDKKIEPAEFIPDNKNLLGILFPILGTICPLSVIMFCLKLPGSDNMKAFVAATGGWTKIGKWFIPGFVGISIWLIALILKFKKYKIIGLNGFGMPHNWTSLIPPYWKKLEIKILKEINLTVRDFIEKIIEGKKVFNRIPDLTIGIIILPLTLAYILIGHFFIAKTTLSDNKCTGCGLCAKNCPNNAIIMKGFKKKRPYWTFKCESCMRCIGYCPEKACSSNLVLIIIHVTACLVFQFSLIFKSFFNYETLNSLKILINVLDYFFYLIVIFFVYVLFFGLNMNSQANSLFTFLNPSSYWRKYREPDIKIEELSCKFNNKIKK